MNEAALPPPALELRGLSKSFGRLRAVRDVSLRVPAGTVAGLVGENGAGKSTLMNLVYGLQRPDAGEVLVDGRAAAIAGPPDALRLGIGMVHQHFMLVPTFTVLENVVLGHEGGPLLAAGLASGRRELRRIAADYGLRVDPDAVVGDLPVGDQQRVEIVKALFRGARLLILDEPTAVLTPGETEGLFAVLRELVGRGSTVVLITHKLREVMAVTDSVWVMRQGAVVAERRTAATSPGEIAELMMGGAPIAHRPAAPAAPGPVLLRTEGLSLRDPATGRALVDGVDLALRSGEIVGVAGVSGNGQGELLEALAGMRAPDGGRIRVGERVVTAADPADADEMRRLGIAHVPEDRHRHGMVAAFTAAETAILGRQNDGRLGRPLLDPRRIEGRCADLMRRLDVRPPDPHQLSGRFSGGNQQKLVLAREVEASPRVLLVGQPSRGVDIGAAALIAAEIRTLRDAGCAILLVSAELDEIRALADRILVMFRGRIVGEVPAGADAGTLGRLMAGLEVPAGEVRAAARRDGAAALPATA